MEQELTKKLAEELMKAKGEARGIHFKSDANYVLRNKGKNGLRRVEQELEKIGCPIKYEKIKNLDFYPVGLRIISLLAIKKTFGWGDKEIRELSGSAAYFSLIVRIYMKFFYSLGKIVKQAPKMWSEYYTVGRLGIPDYNEKEKYAVLELSDFELHPIFCRGMEGYLENIVKMIVKTKKVRCRETKCTFRGNKTHQFLIKWKN